MTGVETDRGRIAAEVVVNCAGQWARQFGLMAGVTVPLYSAEHFYIVTDSIEGVHPELPVMRDPDGYIYFKEEVGGLVMGGFEPEAKPWGMEPHSRRLRVPAAAGGLGPVRDADGERAAPRAVTAEAEVRKFSTAPKASRPTATSSSARRRN